MAAKFVASTVLDTGVISAALPLQSTDLKSTRTSTLCPGRGKSFALPRRQRTVIVRASGMAEPESAGTGKHRL